MLRNMVKPGFCGREIRPDHTAWLFPALESMGKTLRHRFKEDARTRLSPFFAKMFLKKNKDVIQLADLLGHGSVDTTRIYLQKSYDEQKKDFNRNVTW